MRVGTACLLAAAFALLAGCGLPSAQDGIRYSADLRSPSPSALAAPPSESPTGLQAYYQQELEWQDCDDGVECADLTVPFSYVDLEAGGDLELQVYRVPAENERERQGSLVVHNAGYGNSALEASDLYGEALLESFDIVGMDPRGTSGGSAQDCLPGYRYDEFLGLDDSPDSAAEWAALRAGAKSLADACGHSGGTQFLASLSTENSARDLDVLRSALDEERLTLFAQSTSTTLGVTYLTLFPERVGRIVLDSPELPGLALRPYALEQAAAFEEGVDDFLSYCVEVLDDCPLGSSVESARAKLEAFVSGLEAKPLTGSRALTPTLAMAAIRWEIGFGWYDRVAEELAAAFEGRGDALLRRADEAIGRKEDGAYYTNEVASLVTRCLGRTAVPPGEVVALSAALRKASPLLGPLLLREALPCTTWPVRPSRPVTYPPTEPTSPALVVSSRIDPLAPLAWAEKLTSDLPDATLLVGPGSGHLAYRAGDECVDEAIETYLLDGSLPRSSQCSSESDGVTI